MKARNFLLVAALVVMGALALFDAGASREAARIEAAAGRQPEELAALNRRIQASLRAEARREAEAAKLKAMAAAGSAASPGAGAGGSSAPAADWRLRLARNSALRAQYLDVYRGTEGRNWALFFNVHHLSAEARERLTDLLVQHEADQIQVAQQADEQGLDPNSREIRKLNGRLNRQNQDGVAALLGPEDFAAYQQYGKDLGVSYAIVDFAGNMTETADPITPLQGAQLTRVLSDASQKTQYGYSIYGTIDSAQALAGAAGVLDANQLAALTAFLDKNQASQQYRKLSGSP